MGARAVSLVWWSRGDEVTDGDEHRWPAGQQRHGTEVLPPEVLEAFVS